VLKLNDADRQSLFYGLPNPRFRTKVEDYIEASYQSIKSAGGPTAVHYKYSKLTDADACIAFFKEFQGIGEKYARNMPMDIHDHRVRNHFALDHRLKTILINITGRQLTYQDGEEVLRFIASTLNVDGWTFDRVLYRRYAQIMNDLSGLSKEPPLTTRF
jgi:hypothetical protein